MYNKRQVQPSAVDPEIPELEDDSEPDQFADLDTFMTHHNTHNATERIHENILPLYKIWVMMNIMLKSIEQSFKTTHQLRNMTCLHATKKCQDHLRQTLHDDLLKSSKEYSEKAEVKPDMKNFIATNHLATKLIHWRVVFSARSRKINACMKGILHIINILLLHKIMSVSYHARSI